MINESNWRKHNEVRRFSPTDMWCEFWFELLNHNQARTWSRTWNWKFTDTWWCRYCESFYNDNKRVSWSEGFSLSCLNAYDSNLHKYRNEIAILKMIRFLSNYSFVFLFRVQNDNSTDMTLIIVSSLRCRTFWSTSVLNIMNGNVWNDGFL